MTTTESSAPRPLLSSRAEAALGDRHRAVLDELEELFLSHGFAAVTMRDLAAHLRCSLRTLYEIAPSKRRLVLVVLDRFLHRVGRNALAAIEPSAPVPDRIQAYFVGAAELQRRTAAFAEDSAGEPEMLRLLDRHFNYVTSVLERLIAEGIDRGELRPVDPRIAAAALSGTAMFIARPDVVAYIGRSAPAVIAEATDVVFEGLVEPQPAS